MALCAALGVLIIVYVPLHLIVPPTNGVFWNQEPWRYLEVLLWGIAGILVNLIMSTGRYLRWNRFYREGIVMHIAQIVTVPLLALVFVLIISLVKLNVTLTGGKEVPLDLSDAHILVPVSFVIVSRVWVLWGFIRETGGRIIGQRE